MGKVLFGVSGFFLRTDHNGRIQEVFSCSEEALVTPELGSAVAALFAEENRRQLEDFFQRIARFGAAQDFFTLLGRSGRMPASLVGHLAQGDFMLNCFLKSEPVAPWKPVASPLSEEISEKDSLAGWLAIPQLEAENQRLKNLLKIREEMLDLSSDIIFLLSNQGAICEINFASQFNLGYRPTDLVGRSFLDIVHPDDWKKVQKGVLVAFSNHNMAELNCRFSTSNGPYKVMQIKMRWSVATNMVVVMASDISAYHLVSSSLKKSKKQLTEVQRLAKVGTIEIDFSEGMVSVTPAFADLLGLYQLRLPLGTFGERVHPDDYPHLYNAYKNPHPDKNAIQIDYRFAGTDGNWLYIASHAIVERNELGQVTKVISKVHDISERRAIEDALQLGQQQTRLVIETALDAFVGLDQNAIIIDWNYKAEATFGKPRVEVIGKSVKEVLLTPEGTPVFDQDILRLLSECCKEKRPTSRFERTILKPDGSVLKAELSVACISFNNLVFLNSFIRDISDRDKATTLLRQSESRFKALVQSGADIIGLINPDGIYKYVSENVVDKIGYKPHELLGRNGLDLIHPDDLEEAVSLLQKLSTLKNGESLSLPSFRFLHADGHYIWMETTVTNLLADPSVQAIVVNSRDITYKKEAEEERERLITIIEATTDAVGIIDAAGNVIHLNQAFDKLLGISLKGETHTRLEDFHPEWAYKLIKETGIPEAIKNGTWTGETALLSTDGREIPFSQVIISHKNSKGEVEYLSTVARDISEQKKIEFSLNVSRERYKSLFEHNPDGVFALNWEGTVIAINKSLRKMMELAEDDPAPQHFAEYVAKSDMENAIKYFEIAKKAISATFELQLVSASKKIITVQISTTPILVEGKLVGVYGIAKDITEKKQLDEALKQSNEQLRALTAHIHLVREEERKFIAREIHDELGQQLTALKIDISLLANKIDKVLEPEVAKEFEGDLTSMKAISDETIQCIRKLVRSLRPMAIEDLGLISEIRSRLQKFGEMMDMETTLEIDIDKLEFTPEQTLDIFRIFQESLTNISRHAKASAVHVKIWQTQQTYKLEITDNGTGIPDSKLQENTSFGLLGMRERAFNLRGNLEVKANKQGGTTVSLSVPSKNFSRKILQQSNFNN